MANHELLSTDEIGKLRLKVQNWEWSPKDPFVDSLVSMGEQGAELIREEVVRRGRDKVTFVAALGNVKGDIGIAELYKLATDNGGSPDVRCAALLALVKRQGPEATDLLISSFTDRSPSVRSYALGGLAAVGKDGAWDLVFDRLQALIRRRPKVEHGPVSHEDSAACYLIGHANDEVRIEKLVKALDRLLQVAPESHRMLIDLWPEVVEVVERPSGEVVPANRPSLDRVQEWVKEASRGLFSTTK